MEVDIPDDSTKDRVKSHAFQRIPVRTLLVHILSILLVTLLTGELSAWAVATIRYVVRNSRSTILLSW